MKDDSLLYQADGRLWKIQDPGLRLSWIDIHASSKDLIKITDQAGGLPFQGIYDGLHRLVRWTDRRGGVWGLAYDFAGKVKADTTPAITTAHGPGERPVVRYASLEVALLVDPTSGLGTSTNPAPPADSRAVRAKVTSPRGFTTAFALDRFGQATRVEAPQGRTARFTFDTLGRSIVDSLPEGQGHLIRYAWNGPNLTQWKDSTTGRTINYTYDPTYNLLTAMSGDVNSLTNVLSSDKKRTDSTLVGGATSWTKFTSTPITSYFGNPPVITQINLETCSVTNQPARHAVSCSYRNTWNPSGTYQNTDSVLTWGEPPSPATFRAKTQHWYDFVGQRIRTVNAVGDTTRTEYDAIGRVKRVIGPQRDTTTYTRDSLYVTELKDARGQVYRAWPNALGWPDSTEDPGGRRTRFTYDSSGNVLTVVNRRGQTIQFTYDSLDQVRFRIVGTDTTKHFSDPLGRYVATATSHSVDTVKVDAAGRPIAEITCRILVSGNPHQCFQVTSVYGIRDVRDTLKVTSPGLWSTHTAAFHYNGNMLLDTMTNFTGEKQAFTYGGELRDSTRKFLAFQPNLTMTYGHPPWIQGSSSMTFSDASLTQAIGRSYSYDTLSRVTRDHHGTIARPDTMRWTVHGAGRLTKYADTAYTWTADGCSLGVLGASCSFGAASKSAVGAPVTFHYDSVGNPKDSPSQSYGVDPGNRLRRYKHVRMEYDLDGNLTVKRTLNPGDTTQLQRVDSLFWNALGHVDSIHYTITGSAPIRINFGYDGWGRLVRRWFPDFANATTRWLFDGDQQVFELDSLGARRAYWSFYPGTDEPQSVGFPSATGPDSTVYFITDALHNVVARLKSNGGTYALYTQYRYGPFGDSLGISGSTKWGSVRFKGAEWFGGFRLYRMGARYYDPDVGRFISEDPIGLEGGINQYAFAGNDPVNGYDPSGTCGKLCEAFAFLFLQSLFMSQVNDLAFAALGGGPCDDPRPPVLAFGQGPDPACEGALFNPRGTTSWIGLAIVAYTMHKALKDAAKAHERVRQLMKEGRPTLGNYAINHRGNTLVLQVDRTPELKRRGTPSKPFICRDIALAVNREYGRFWSGIPLVLLDLGDPEPSAGWDLTTTGTGNIVDLHQAFVDFGCR